MSTGPRHVIVAGGGNAGLCAALSAAEQGARVTLLERAPMAKRGGNTAFTAGAMRVAYEGDEGILRLVPDLSAEQLAISDFGVYDQSRFFDDLARVTRSRADPELAQTLVSRSLDTLKWMRTLGVRFVPIYGRQAFEVNGRDPVWGGRAIGAGGR